MTAEFNFSPLNEFHKMHVRSENQNSQKNPDRTLGSESIRVRSIPGSHTGFGHNTIASTLIVTLSVKRGSSEWEGQSYMSLALMADFRFFSPVQNLPKIRTHEVDSGSEIFYRVGLTPPIQRDYDEAGSDLHHSYECGMKIYCANENAAANHRVEFRIKVSIRTVINLKF